MCDHHRTLGYSTITDESTAPSLTKSLPTIGEVLDVFLPKKTDTSFHTKDVLHTTVVDYDRANRYIDRMKHRNALLWFVTSTTPTDSSLFPYLIFMLENITYAHIQEFIALAWHPISRQDEEVFTSYYEQTCILINLLNPHQNSNDYWLWRAYISKFYRNEKNFNKQKKIIKDKINSLLVSSWYTTKDSYQRTYSNLLRSGSKQYTL